MKEYLELFKYSLFDLTFTECMATLFGIIIILTLFIIICIFIVRIIYLIYDLKYRINKAIEYINSFEYHIPDDNMKELLDILKGNNNE